MRLIIAIAVAMVLLNTAPGKLFADHAGELLYPPLHSIIEGLKP
jgi:hypothetical protein